MRKTKTKFLFSILAAVVVVGAGAYAFRGPIREYVTNAQRESEIASLPKPVPYTPPTNTNQAPKPANKNANIQKPPAKNANTNAGSGVNSNTNTGTNAPVLANAINLAVPFTSQAPFKVWDALHEDACEEASVVMVDRYLSGKGISGPEDADAEIKKLVAWEDVNFGINQLSISAAQTVELIKANYGYKNVEIVKNPTVEQLKAFLNQKLPVIIPAGGKLLGNPNFRNGGPLYHMLVLKGYTKDGKWITNDPGTRLGADYVYASDVLMNAIHDWNGGNVMDGQKVVIVVHPN